MNAVENARKILAGAERAEANVQRIKNLICRSLGLPVIDGERYDNLQPVRGEKYNSAQTFQGKQRFQENKGSIQENKGSRNRRKTKVPGTETGLPKSACTILPH